MTTLPPPQPTPLLQGRSDNELTWFRRRSVVQAAALWVAGGGWAAAHAQARSNVVDIKGDVLRNGEPLTAQQTISANDRIETGSGSTLVFSIGDSAFMVRQNSRMALESDTPTAVKVLRLLSGAVATVWGRGTDRQIVLPTATAGIRGTGVYAEVFADQDQRGYLCNCYGTVDLTAGSERLVSQSSYHQSFWAETAPRNGRLLTPAGAINHTDEEMEFLAGLVNQRTAWQVLGRKGTKDGSGGATAPAGSYGTGTSGSSGSSYGPPGSRD